MTLGKNSLIFLLWLKGLILRVFSNTFIYYYTLLKSQGDKLSKIDVYNLLKKNQNVLMSASEIIKILEVNKQSVYSSLNKLVADKEIFFKEFQKKGCPPKKLYFVKPKNVFLDDTLKVLDPKNLDEVFLMTNKQDIILIHILAELKKLNKLIEGKKDD